MLKTLKCREHGGTFQVVPKRGRPPTKCSPENVCTRYGKAEKGLAEFVPASDKPALERARKRLPKSLTTSPPAEAVSKPRSEPTASLTQAMAAKSLLEAQGWVCTGKARGQDATITASRGEETLFLGYRDGELLQQNYLLWNTDQPSANGKPASQLTLDPDEMTDSELVRWLSGMRVTWWNRLGKEEKSVIGSNKITIEHSFAGNGDETPGDRIVKFVDHEDKAFRAFRVAALIKVG